MRCERVQFLYDEYSQGTLPVATLGRVEEHLAGCPACREFYEQSDLVSRLIRKSSEVAHPGPQYFEDLHSRVLAALDQPETEDFPDPSAIIDIPDSQWRRPLWWVGAMAAAGLLALAGAPALLSRPSPGRTQVIAMAKPPVAPPARTPAPTPAAAPAPRKTASPAQPPATPLPPGQTLEKSVTAPLPEPTLDIDAFIKDKFSASRDGVTPAEQLANDEAQAVMTSLRQKTEVPGELSSEVYAQLQLLKAQIMDGRSEDLQRNLRDLETRVGPRVSEQLKQSPLVKQVNRYLAAGEDLKAGRIDDALTKYRQVDYIDKQSPLAIKAALQIADILYSEFANFPEAMKYYKRCLAAGEKSQLSSPEQQNVKRQLDRLERYKANNWEALNLLHQVHHGKWTEVLAAMERLTALSRAEALLPEAARTIVKRMEAAGDAPNGDIIIALYKLLEKQAEIQQNGDVRALLELALGDMALGQLQDAQQANDHYGKAAASGSTDVAATARVKLDQLSIENLAGLVRKK